MQLLITCSVGSFVLGIILCNKFSFTYYKVKIRQLMKICDRYKELNKQLLDQIDCGE